MIRFEQLNNKPALLNSLTGLTVEGFQALLPAFRVAYENHLDQRDESRALARQGERGAGQKGALPRVPDKLLFILFYFRVYPVQVVQGFLFGMGHPQANEWIHRLSPVLKVALGYDLQLPARQPQDMKAVLETCRGLAFIIDGTARPIRRPHEATRPKANYSGQKYRHPRTHNVIGDQRTGKVKGLSPTVAGKRHDKKAPFHRAVPSGKTPAFRATRRKTSRLYSRLKSLKDVTSHPKKKPPTASFPKNESPLNSSWAGSKSFALSTMFSAICGKDSMIWSWRLLAGCTTFVWIIR